MIRFPMIRLPLFRAAPLCVASVLLAGCGTLSAKPVHHAKAHAAHPAKQAAPAKPQEDEFVGLAQWRSVSLFIDDMVTRHGFDRAALEATMNRARHADATIQLIKPAPASKPKNWGVYRARFVEPVRIDAGVRFWNEHADALERAERQYGVPAEIIVGILGVETLYGRNTGNFRVMDAIATLAFDYPDTPTREARMAFFRGELENTLLFARDAGIDPFSLLGSYAGAIGWPQFMPGAILRYAVDFDGDGRIDLRNSPVDAIGSVANYLMVHGWKRGEPIVFPAVAPTDPDGANRIGSFLNQGLEAKFEPGTLRAAGVRTITPVPEDMRFGLVDLQNGFEPTEYWLGGENFFAITRYNRSYFYAMSVVDLGHAVRSARSIDVEQTAAGDAIVTGR